ncbi:hypothetical protein Tco_1522585 [Tanacetum coccineum]
MIGEREMTLPPGFSTLTPIPSPNANELPPITVSTYTAITLKNTPLIHCASTSANPNPMISPAFVEANYEVFESLLREQRKQICNKDLRTELEYFSEEYDKEREMEPRLVRVRETTPVLCIRSSRAQRQRDGVVEFEDTRNRDGKGVKRNFEGGRPSEHKVDNNRSPGKNLPPLLVARFGRSENNQSMQSSLTSAYEGSYPSTKIGGNPPPDGMHLSHYAQSFIPNSLQPSSGPIPTHVNPYSQPNVGPLKKTPWGHPSELNSSVSRWLMRSSGPIPTHVNPYSQPNVGALLGQPSSYTPQFQGG